MSTLRASLIDAATADEQEVVQMRVEEVLEENSRLFADGLVVAADGTEVICPDIEQPVEQERPTSGGAVRQGVTSLRLRKTRATFLQLARSKPKAVLLVNTDEPLSLELLARTTLGAQLQQMQQSDSDGQQRCALASVTVFRDAQHSFCANWSFMALIVRYPGTPAKWARRALLYASRLSSHHDLIVNGGVDDQELARTLTAQFCGRYARVFRKVYVTEGRLQQVLAGPPLVDVELVGELPNADAWDWSRGPGCAFKGTLFVLVVLLNGANLAYFIAALFWSARRNVGVLAASAAFCVFLGVINIYVAILGCQPGARMLKFVSLHLGNAIYLTSIGVPIHYVTSNGSWFVTSVQYKWSVASLVLIPLSVVIRLLLHMYYFRRRRRKNGDCIYFFAIAGFMFPVGGD